MARAAQRNPWVGITYIPDNIRMEEPPAWFLQQLHDYDNDIVLLPSRQRPFAYVIARRKKFSAGITDKAIEDTVTSADTVMCFQHGLVPVSLMFKTGPTWDADRVLRSLQARDLWKHGGADKVADMLEAQEDAEREATRRAIRQDMWDRSGDAWRSYQFRTGQAVGQAITKGAEPGRRTNMNYVPLSRSTVKTGSAIFVTDRD